LGIQLLAKWLRDCVSGDPATLTRIQDHATQTQRNRLKAEALTRQREYVEAERQRDEESRRNEVEIDLARVEALNPDDRARLIDKVKSRPAFRDSPWLDRWETSARARQLICMELDKESDSG